MHLGAHRDETEDRGRGSQSNQFFKCVCQCCEGRPHAFACDGGCIYGGTAWERHAGSLHIVKRNFYKRCSPDTCAASMHQFLACASSAVLHHLRLTGWLPYTGNAGKKWENSIKVDSEKGPVTLKRWLNTTGVDKAREIGALKGRTIWVLWPDENAFYRGKVTGFTPDKGLHHVDYDDGTSPSPLHQAAAIYVHLYLRHRRCLNWQGTWYACAYSCVCCRSWGEY